MHDVLRMKFVLKHMSCRRKLRLDITSAQFVIQCDIGAALTLEMFQVGKRDRRFQFIVDMNRRGGRFHFVENRRQFFVLRSDQAGGIFSHMRVSCKDHSDRLSDIAHLVQGEHRLIVKRRSVIGLGNQPLDILTGDHRMHTGYGACRARVDRHNASMGNAAAEHLAVQYAWQADVVDVFGAPGDLGCAFHARDRAADLLFLDHLGVHRL